MNRIYSNTVYGTLVGLTIAVGLSNWQVFNSQALLLLALPYLIAGLVGGMAMNAIKHVSFRMAGPHLIPLTMVVSLALMTILLSPDRIHTIMYLVFGGVIGAGIGLIKTISKNMVYTISMALVAAAAALFTIQHVWSVTTFTQMHWLVMMPTVLIGLSVLSVFSFDENDRSATRTTVLLLLFMTLWFAPLYRENYDTRPEAIPLLLPITFGLGYVAFLYFATKKILTKFWLTPHIDQIDAVRKVLVRFASDTLIDASEFENLATKLTLDQGTLSIQMTLQKGGGDHWHNIIRTANTPLQNDLTQWFAALSQKSLNPAGRENLCLVLEYLVLKKEKNLWQTNFDTLIQYDQLGAISLTGRRFADRDHELLLYWANSDNTLPVDKLSDELASVFGTTNIKPMLLYLKRHKLPLQRLSMLTIGKVFAQEQSNSNPPILQMLTHAEIYLTALLNDGKEQTKQLAISVLRHCETNQLLSLLHSPVPHLSTMTMAVLSERHDEQSFSGLLEELVLAKDNPLWQANFDTLIQYDKTLAMSLTMLRFAENDSDLLLHWANSDNPLPVDNLSDELSAAFKAEHIKPMIDHLQHNNVQLQRLSMLTIGKVFAQEQSNSTSLRSQMLTHAETYLTALLNDGQNQTRQLAMSILRYCGTQQLLTWLESPIHHFSSMAMCELCDRYAEMPETKQHEIEQALQTQYSMPASVSKHYLEEGDDILTKWLYPTQIRPIVTTDDASYLEEMVDEPDDLVTASHITTWFYQKQLAIKSVVVSGHSNHVICKAVSTKIYNTILELSNNVQDAIITTGAGYIKVKVDAGTQDERDNHLPARCKSKAGIPGNTMQGLLSQFNLRNTPLRTLQRDLQGMQATGMVQTKVINTLQHDTVVQQIQVRIKQAVTNNQPMVTYESPTQGGAVFLPFFEINRADNQPLQFEIPRTILGNDFNQLQKNHHDELKAEMIADANRRKQVYEEWLAVDIMSFERNIKDLLSIIAPAENWHLKLQNFQGVASAYLQACLDGGNFQHTQSQHLAHRILDLFLNLTNTRSPVVGNEEWVQLLAPGEHLFFGFWQLIRASFPEIRMNMTPEILNKLRESKYVVSGSRDYADAVIVEGKERKDVSLFFLTLDNSPGLLCSTLNAIHEISNLLRKFDPTHPQYTGKQLEQMSFSVLIDSFLRGWPSVFLTKNKTKGMYDQWLARTRDRVWEYIHGILREQKIQITPLQSDSVIFSIRELARNRILITPYYLTSIKDMAAFISPHIGIPFYINTWQRRERQFLEESRPKSNQRRSSKAIDAGLRAIDTGDSDEAFNQFRLALNTHMVFGAEKIFLQYREAVTRNMEKHKLDYIKLGKLVTKSPSSRNDALEVLMDFEQIYPHFIPEVYLLKSFYMHPASEQWVKCHTEIDDLSKKRSKQFRKLEEDHVLIYDESRKDYILNEHNEEAKTYMHHKSLTSWLEMPQAERFELVRPQLEANIRPLIQQSLLSNDTHRSLLSNSFLLASDLSELEDESDNLNVMDFLDASQEEIMPWHMPQMNAARLAVLMNDTVEQQLQEHYSDQALREQLKRIPVTNFERITLLMKHKDEIESKLQESNKIGQEIWMAIQQNPDADVRQAMALDNAYVRKVFNNKNHQQASSKNFGKHIQPLVFLIDADEHLALVDAINKKLYFPEDSLRSQIEAYEGSNSTNNHRGGQARQEIVNTIHEVANILVSIRRSSKLEEPHLLKLTHLISHFQNIELADSMTCNRVIKMLDDVKSQHFNQAYRVYRVAAQQALEFTDIRHVAAELEHKSALYAASLNQLLGKNEAPLISGFMGTNFTIQDANVIWSPRAQLVLNRRSKAIQIQLTDQALQTVLNYDDLSEEDCAHLEHEFSNEMYVKKLKSTHQKVAYALLLTPIKLPSQLGIWWDVMQRLRPWLLHVMATTGVGPYKIPTRDRKKAMEAFEGKPIVTAIHHNGGEIQAAFLHEFGYDTY